MLAQTFKLLAEKGKDGFYGGPVAKSIIQAIRREGGFHTSEDLKDHADRYDEDLNPISIRLQDERTSPPTEVDLWEHAPNGQGIVALMALGIWRQLEKAGRIPFFSVGDHNTAKYGCLSSREYN